jgi:hypothetical protein
MKTFFSLVSIQTNPYSLEKVVMGVLAISENEIYFNYSKSKLLLLDKLSSHGPISSFSKTLLQQIKNKVVTANALLSDGQQKLKLYKSIFSKEYIDYLNQYCDGLLQFSEPDSLPFDFTPEKYAIYYHDFVGEFLDEAPKKNKNFSTKLKPYFEKEGIKEKADLKYSFEPASFKGILKETHISLITKNGDINAIQTVDFETGEHTVVNHLYETKIIQDALLKVAGKAKFGVKKIKIVYEEPQIGTQQHDLFDLSINTYKDVFDFITPAMLDIETEMISKSDNIKFSEFLLTLDI